MAHRHGTTRAGARWWMVLLTALVVLVVSGCGDVSPASPDRSAAPASEAPPAVLPSGSSSAATPADLILFDGDVVTMDPQQPRAQAVAISGDRIVAVGSNDAVLVLRGSGTTVIDLEGKVVVPGFIDAHQHRLSDGPSALSTTPEALAQAAVSQGLTTIDELYVDQGRLDRLEAMDRAGSLPLRVNAYLAVQENSASGAMLGDYYQAYASGEQLTPHVRVAGIKVFTDFNNATILLWRQPDLDAFLLARLQEGWRIAIKTVSTRSLAMILAALESAQSTDASLPIAGTRIEHALFMTPAQIASIVDLGVEPVINLNVPGELVGVDDGLPELIASEPAGSYAPWRDLFTAGLAPAGMSGFPSLYVDEPVGQPFGSPLHLLYQGVSRAGNLGVQSPTELLSEALTAEQALQALTVNAAQAAFQADQLGSLRVGYLADLVVLSGDPLSVPTAQINELQVLETIVGGRTVYCAEGASALCAGTPRGEEPSTPPVSSPGAGSSPSSTAWTATASISLPDHPPSAAIDGDQDTWWSAGAGPVQWLQLDLGATVELSSIRLTTSQYPAGATVHRLLIGDSPDDLEVVHTFSGSTSDLQALTFDFATGTAARYIRIETTSSPSWVAWREIDVKGTK